MKIPVWALLLALFITGIVIYNYADFHVSKPSEVSKVNYDSVFNVSNKLQKKFDSLAVIESKTDTIIKEIIHEIPVKINRVRSFDAQHSVLYFLGWTRQYSDSTDWERYFRITTD